MQDLDEMLTGEAHAAALPYLKQGNAREGVKNHHLNILQFSELPYLKRIK